MGPARADRSGDHDVLVALQVVAGGQLSELRPLDPTQRVPVESVHGLDFGEACSAQLAGHSAVAPEQELLVVSSVVRGPADEL